MAKQLSLTKTERLKSKKIFSELFSSGKSLFVYPIKLIYIQLDTDCNSPALFGCVASKRNFKKAVDRNNIKRHLREAYRQQKPKLYHSLEHQKKSVALLYIYVSKSQHDLTILHRSIAQLNELLIKKLDPTITNLT